VGTKLLPVTAGGVALGTAAVTTAANFEEAMSSVKALLSSTSTDLEGDMEKLETAAREAGETTKFSATEAAEAMSYMGLAGWNADQMCEGLSGILNLAAASEMDLASASDIVTDYLTAFGLAASDSEMLVDKMAYAMSNSNTTTAQLGEAYKNCAATATQLGYDLDDTTAALMVMADGGIKGGEAGTALSSIMTRLGTNTSGCRDTLAEYGVTVYDAEGNVQSLSSILSSMQGVWSTLTDEEKANLAYVVAGKTAQSELMTVLGESTGSFDAYREGLAGCSRTAADMAEIMQDNLAGQLTILKSQLQELGISFGQMLLPVIKSVVGVIQNLVDWLNGMDEGMRTVILTIALVAAAIGPVLIVVGKVISSVGTIMTLVPKLVSAFNAVKTAFSALSAVMMANPIALVIAAIAALVAAFIYLWNTNEEFRQFWIDLWESIKAAVTAAWEAISSFLTAAWESISETAQSVWEALSEFFSDTWENIQEIISTVVGAVSDFLSDAWSTIQTVTGTVWTAIQGIFTTVWNAIQSVVTTVVTAVQTFITTAWNAIQTVITTVLGAIQTVITTVWNAILSVITTVVNGISSTVSKVWNTILSTVSKIVNSIKSAVSTAFSAMWNGIRSTVSGIYNTVKDGFNQAVSFIKGLASSAFSWGSDIINGIVNGINKWVLELLSNNVRQKRLENQ